MNVLDPSQNFLGLDKEHSTYDNSKSVVIQAPYEHTVSYGSGTKNGPKEIINASQYVEFYDEETDSEYCFEEGFATLEEIDFENKANEEALQLIYNQVKNVIEDDKFAITLGGEHTISSACIQAHHEKYPNMSVLQFDAHSDLRDTYENSKWSHACVMARVCEFMDPKHITQVGIRAQAIEESKFIKENGIKTFYANEIKRGVFGSNWQKELVDTLNQDVYITFDVDYFDPSIMPATGTPEPDGFQYQETIEIIREIKRQGKQVVGLDLVELAPISGLHHSDILCASLIYKTLSLLKSKRS